MIREYKTIQEISGPLMVVNRVQGVTYDELAEIELSDGSVFTLYYGRSAENALCRICYTVWRV